MKTIIIGAGGFGREVLALIKSINRQEPRFEVIGFVDDGIEKGKFVNGLTILGAVNDVDDLKPEALVLAIANPQIRESVIQHLGDKYLFPNLIDPSVKLLDEEHISMGKGNIICSGSIFTTNITVGNFNIFNLSCTIGHDAFISDFCSVMPGVNISGGATIKNCVYVGTGAKLIKATILEEGCTVGAGAVVDKDVKQSETVVGIPARPIVKQQ